jgi:hypothetical protein
MHAYIYVYRVYVCMYVCARLCVCVYKSIYSYKRNYISVGLTMLISFYHALNSCNSPTQYKLLQRRMQQINSILEVINKWEVWQTNITLSIDMKRCGNPYAVDICEEPMRTVSLRYQQFNKGTDIRADEMTKQGWNKTLRGKGKVVLN